MFKKYNVKVKSNHPAINGKRFYTVEFYVHSKPTRRGFCHEACVLGPLPVKEGSVNPHDRAERRARKSYLNRTWESWSGQDVLVMLWDKLMGLGWIDTSRLPKKNPFKSGEEPKHEYLWDPNELFARN